MLQFIRVSASQIGAFAASYGHIVYITVKCFDFGLLFRQNKTKHLKMSPRVLGICDTFFIIFGHFKMIN